MVAKREELKRRASPKQITGRQLVWVVRQFFNVDDGNRKASFELSTLLAISWPGDAKLAQFKDRWDHIVRNLRSPIGKRDLEDILVSKLRGSDVLKPHLDYYDRLPTTHSDRCYDWVSQLIDTLVAKARQKRNTESLVLDASGREQIPERPGRSAMPGRVSDQDSRQDGPPETGGSQLQGGNPGAEGSHADGGKGGRRRGKRQQRDTESEAGGSVAGGAPDTPRSSSLTMVPADHKCCIKHLWGKCADPEKCPYGPHLAKPTEGIKRHPFYQTLLKELGEPRGPPQIGNAAGSNEKAS